MKDINIKCDICNKWTKNINRTCDNCFLNLIDFEFKEKGVK